MTRWSARKRHFWSEAKRNPKRQKDPVRGVGVYKERTRMGERHRHVITDGPSLTLRVLFCGSPKTTQPRKSTRQQRSLFLRLCLPYNAPLDIA